jgi:hypothetical protein
MHSRTAAIISLAFTLAACGDDATPMGGGTGKIETEEIQLDLDPDGDGLATASLSGDVATMTCTLSQPLREIGEVGDEATNDDALAEIADAMGVTVSSPRSGASVTLGSGTLVGSPPTSPGHWSLSLASSREELSIRWYNGTTNGLSMSPGQTYNVLYSLGENCCVEEVPTSSISFQL